MLHGLSARPLAFLGCLVAAAATTTPVPRRDAVGTAKQITTITADAATNDETYGITLTSTTTETSGQTASATYVADGSATVAEIAAGLVAAIEDQPDFMRFVYTVEQSTADVVITLKEGETATFTLTSVSGDLSQAATQAAGSIQAYTFGRAVEVVAGPDTTVGNEGVQPLQADTYDGPLVTVTINTADNNSDSTTVFRYTPFGGPAVLKTLTFTSTAAADTTADAGVEAAETLFPNATVTDGGTDDFTIQLPPGSQIEIETATSNEGTLDVSVALTSLETALPRCTIVANDQLDGITDAYPDPTVPTTTQHRTIPTWDSGVVAVATSDSSISHDALAYAETAAGSNKGLIYDTPSATRVPVLIGPERKPARFRGLDPHDSTLAHLQLGA